VNLSQFLAKHVRRLQYLRRTRVGLFRESPSFTLNQTHPCNSRKRSPDAVRECLLAGTHLPSRGGWEGSLWQFSRQRTIQHHHQLTNCFEMVLWCFSKHGRLIALIFHSFDPYLRQSANSLVGVMQ